MVCANIKDKVITGFYIEEFHGVDKCQSVLDNGGIKCDEELWKYILSLGAVTFKEIAEEREYTISDKYLFEKIVQSDTTPQQPSMEERIAALELLMMGVI